jgi:hypothetical protein
MEFSPFLRSLFPTEQRFDLMITASWYHTWSSLPPYIVLHIDPKGKDFSYEILLNLDTLDVIRVSVVLKEFDSTTRYVPVELSESQKQDIKKSIKYIE